MTILYIQTTSVAFVILQLNTLANDIEEFLKGGENAELPTLEEISLMTDEEATEIFSEYTFQEIECIWGEFDYYYSGLYGGGWEIGDKAQKGFWSAFAFCFSFAELCDF